MPPADADFPGSFCLLHGSGGDEYDLLETGRVVAPRDYMIASLRAPMARNYDRGISGRGAYR